MAARCLQLAMLSVALTAWACSANAELLSASNTGSRTGDVYLGVHEVQSSMLRNMQQRSQVGQVGGRRGLQQDAGSPSPTAGNQTSSPDAPARRLITTGPFGGNTTSATYLGEPPFPEPMSDAEVSEEGLRRITHISLQLGQLPFRGMTNPSELVVMNLNFTYEGTTFNASTVFTDGIGRYNAGFQPSANYSMSNHTLELQPGEYITEVQGSSDYVINQISFHTNRGRVWGPFGGSGGRPFAASPIGRADNVSNAALRWRTGDEAFLVRFADASDNDEEGDDYFGYMAAASFVWEVLPGAPPAPAADEGVVSPDKPSSGDKAAADAATVVTAVAVAAGVVAAAAAAVTAAPSYGIMVAAASVGGGGAASGAGGLTGAAVATGSSIAANAALGLLLDLQHASLLSASSSNLTSLYTNLFGGLSWLNFQVYMGVHRGDLSSPNVSQPLAQGSLRLWQYGEEPRREAAYNISSNRLAAMTLWLALVVLMNWLLIRLLWRPRRDPEEVKRIYQEAEVQLRADLAAAGKLAVTGLHGGAATADVMVKLAARRGPLAVTAGGAEEPGTGEEGAQGYGGGSRQWGGLQGGGDLGSGGSRAVGTSGHQGGGPEEPAFGEQSLGRGGLGGVQGTALGDSNGEGRAQAGGIDHGHAPGSVAEGEAGGVVGFAAWARQFGYHAQGAAAGLRDHALGVTRRALRQAPVLLAFPRLPLAITPYLIIPLAGAAGMLLAAGGPEDTALGLFALAAGLGVCMGQTWLVLHIYRRRGPQHLHLVAYLQPPYSMLPRAVQGHLGAMWGLVKRAGTCGLWPRGQRAGVAGTAGRGGEGLKDAGGGQGRTDSDSSSGDSASSSSSGGGPQGEQELGMEDVWASLSRHKPPSYRGTPLPSAPSHSFDLPASLGHELLPDPPAAPAPPAPAPLPPLSPDLGDAGEEWGGEEGRRDTNGKEAGSLLSRSHLPNPFAAAGHLPALQQLGIGVLRVQTWRERAGSSSSSGRDSGSVATAAGRRDNGSSTESVSRSASGRAAGSGSSMRGAGRRSSEGGERDTAPLPSSQLGRRDQAPLSLLGRSASLGRGGSKRGPEDPQWPLLATESGFKRQGSGGLRAGFAAAVGSGRHSGLVPAPSGVQPGGGAHWGGDPGNGPLALPLELRSGGGRQGPGDVPGASVVAVSPVAAPPTPSTRRPPPPPPVRAPRGRRAGWASRRPPPRPTTPSGAAHPPPAELALPLVVSLAPGVALGPGGGQGAPSLVQHRSSSLRRRGMWGQQSDAAGGSGEEPEGSSWGEAPGRSAPHEGQIWVSGEGLAGVASLGGSKGKAGDSWKGSGSGQGSGSRSGLGLIRPASLGVSSLMSQMRAMRELQERARQALAEVRVQRQESDVLVYLRSREGLPPLPEEPGGQGLHLGGGQDDMEEEEEEEEEELEWVYEAELYAVPEPLRSYCYRTTGLSLGHLIYILNYTNTAPLQEPAMVFTPSPEAEASQAQHSIGQGEAGVPGQARGGLSRLAGLLTGSAQAFFSKFKSGHRFPAGMAHQVELELLHQSLRRKGLVGQGGGQGAGAAWGSMHGEEPGGGRHEEPSSRSDSESECTSRTTSVSPSSSSSSSSSSTSGALASPGVGPWGVVGEAGDAGGSSQACANMIDEQFLVSREVFERFGPLFEALRPDSPWSFCYQAVRGWRNFVVALLTGVQMGGGLAPGSAAAQAVIFQAVIANLALMAYVWRWNPFRSNFSNVIEKCTCVFAVATCVLLFVLAFDLSAMRQVAHEVQQALLAVTIMGAALNLLSSVWSSVHTFAQALSQRDFGEFVVPPAQDWREGVESGVLGGAALGQVVLVGAPDEGLQGEDAVDVGRVVVEGLGGMARVWHGSSRHKSVGSSGHQKGSESLAGGSLGQAGRMEGAASGQVRDGSSAGGSWEGFPVLAHGSSSRQSVSVVPASGAVHVLVADSATASLGQQDQGSDGSGSWGGFGAVQPQGGASGRQQGSMAAAAGSFHFPATVTSVQSQGGVGSGSWRGWGAQ